jgi:trimethylamine:corrinoid methyltransferase-like protein
MSTRIRRDPSGSLPLLQLLASRLERLSADSRWAHRASGLRGNIIKLLEYSEQKSIPQERMDALIEHGFHLLRQAAREIPDLDEYSDH